MKGASHVGCLTRVVVVEGCTISWRAGFKECDCVSLIYRRVVDDDCGCSYIRITLQVAVPHLSHESFFVRGRLTVGVRETRVLV